eukprot:2065250-Pleurochrysis_carterae.AAC.1
MTLTTNGETGQEESGGGTAKRDEEEKRAKGIGEKQKGGRRLKAVKMEEGIGKKAEGIGEKRAKGEVKMEEEQKHWADMGERREIKSKRYQGRRSAHGMCED